MRNTLAFILAAMALGSSLPAQDTNGRSRITTGTLFEEMVDLGRLPSFPDPLYRTIQFSSYDRRSRIPNGPDWFANSDGFGEEPVPNFEKVLKEPDQSGMGEYLICDEDILSGSWNTRLDKDDIWAKGKILIWTPEKMGDRMRMHFDVDSTGKKQIHVTAGLFPKSGQIKVFLDGRQLLLRNDEKIIDLFDPDRTLLRDFPFKPLEVKSGRHELSIEFADNTKRVANPEIGIDFIWVQTREP